MEDIQDILRFGDRFYDFIIDLPTTGGRDGHGTASRKGCSDNTPNASALGSDIAKAKVPKGTPDFDSHNQHSDLQSSFLSPETWYGRLPRRP
jgi:hypothetical protein